MSDTPTPENKYLPLSEIPPEVEEAAETIFTFFEMENMQGWEFSHVADRRLLGKLERERDRWKARCEAAEGYISLSPCDPDIYLDQYEAFKKWEKLKGEDES